MIPHLRRRFNDAFSPDKYRRLLELVERGSGVPPAYPHCETPFFLPGDLTERCVRYGREMVEQLLASAEYRRASDRAVPPQWKAPNEADRPLFVQADFGLIRDASGGWEPRLVEIQGFPSLFAYQPLFARSYREAYDLDPRLESMPDHLSEDEYLRMLRRAIAGDCDPENVFLTEIDPDNQKTRCDFALTEKLFGVRTADIAKLRKEGRRLYYNGVPVRRIYNRAIADELERRRITLAFDFRDDLEVEWAGHPNWYFRLSKFSLPYLQHPGVPTTRFLDQVDDLGDPCRLVLKPLFSFAGAGVVIGPSREQIDAIPPERRADYIVQELVRFEPSVETPYGATKIEIRVMYLWLDELRAVNTIIRAGRGAMMGVDHNKGLAWVGASAGFFEP